MRAPSMPGAPNQDDDSDDDTPAVEPSLSDTPAVGTVWERSAPELGEHAEVDHFRIKRKLGQGGMGEVYLAKDATLGRLVALKLIKPQLLQKVGAQRFLNEARVTAQLSHPNIVVIHYLGQFSGQPYLALEYLEGETLRERMESEASAPARVMRAGAAIARALEHAHSKGVRHCDLKPSNIIVSQDGRLRILDFGLAELVTASEADVPKDSSTEKLIGTPAYMSPEQWNRKALTAAVDIWAMGVILYEMAAGKRPFHGKDEAALRERVTGSEVAPALEARELPAEIVELIAQCLAKDPARRPAAARAAETLESALARSSRFASSTEDPFRGLLPFEEQHAASFFGREEEIGAFVERMRTEPVSAVVGPSGAGKSSFVRAGVIPRLREDGAWKILSLRPGPSPFRALAMRLLQLASRDSGGQHAGADDIEALAKELENKTGALNLYLEARARESGENILLFVDQLEEVCTEVESPKIRELFLAAIVSAVEDSAERVRVVFTVRDDFLGRLPIDRRFQRALGRQTVLGPLGRDQLRDAIVQPVARLGYAYENISLVEEMLDEISGEAARLPLLQFACKTLWERRDISRRILVRAELAKIGGIGGALSAYADQLLAGFSPEELRIARAIFLRLVTPEGARRSLSKTSLLELGPSTEGVLTRLIDSRLLATRKATDISGAAASVEIIHESLIRAWPLLVRWLDESREERVLLAQLEAASALWEQRGRPSEETWHGDALLDAERRLSLHNIEPPAPVAEFLGAGREREKKKRRARTVLTAVGASLLVLITAISWIVTIKFADGEAKAIEQSKEINMATADLGRFELELRPFDWDVATSTIVEVPASELPALDWVLHAPSRENPNRPGAPLEEGSVRRARIGDGNNILLERVEARAGRAFLEITGRGRAGENCGAAWVRLNALPGYRERETQPPIRISLALPTCAATRENMLAVPAGKFFRDGPGAPPVKNASFVDTERVVTLRRFAIDRTEVSNAMYEIFSRSGQHSGFFMPHYPKTTGALHDAGLADRPVSNLAAAEAEAFCAYFGKRLPTTDEWEKAARGGWTLDEAGLLENKYPRRNLPWGTGYDGVIRANLNGSADGYEGAAPVGSFPAGASPYGVLDLTGNVDEWTASEPADAVPGSQRVIRGGAFDADPKDERETIAYENRRDPRYLAFSIGFRCVADDAHLGATRTP